MNFTLLSALFLFIVSLAHLARVILGVQIIANDHVVPIWLSVVAFLVTLFLAIMLYKEGKSRKSGGRNV